MPGGTTRTDVNRRLGEVLKEIILIRKAVEKGPLRSGGGGGRTTGAGAATDVSKLALEATQLLLATESTLSSRASEATLSSLLTRALLLATESNQLTMIGQQTEGGLTTAEWLEDIEADVDGLEGRLDTLIAANAADFITNTAEIALVVAQLILNVAAVVANGLLIAFGNGRLGDIRDNTDPAGGLTIAEWLEDIEADVDGIEGLITSTNTKLDTANDTLDDVLTELRDLTFPDSDVDVHTVSPATDKSYLVRPDSTDSTCFLQWVAIKNADPIFPITFRIFLRDGAANKAQRPDLLKTISAQQTDTIILNLNIRRNCFLLIEASISSSHIFTLPYLNNGAVTFSNAA